MDRPRAGVASGRSKKIYDRAAILHGSFRERVAGWTAALGERPDPRAPVREGFPLTGVEFLELFESQMISRHLDLVSRVLRERNQGYSTIASAGHEGNAVVGRLTRPTDPAFLHYRSGAFMAERSRQMPDVDFIYDTLLSLVASVEDPVSGGRHNGWGSVPMWVFPQTRTIASHLPKAIGMAIGIRRAMKMGIEPTVPADSLVVCSFGDASVNHSTALGALSSALRAVYRRVDAPVLFVCEDNGFGNSAHTPPGWIEDGFGDRRGLRYYAADGLDLVEADKVSREAIETCRAQRRPVFLHLNVVRLLDHAGSDLDLADREPAEVEETESRDPLLRAARTACVSGLLTPEEIVERYDEVRARVDRAAERAVGTPQLRTAEEIVSTLAPYSADEVAEEAARKPNMVSRKKFWSDELPESGPPRHLSALINTALHDLMLKYPEALVFGEDVALEGGAYHVTADLLKRFGHPRVFNTVLDEQTILGLAQGLACCGLLPFPEIKNLASFHNACDQIRGEACSTQFFSRGRFRNPMVLRIASLGCQEESGGHFHNDNSIAALRDIPGLVIACPSRGDDAAGMLRTAAAMARVDGRVVAFLEPIALYATKDLYEPEDGAWCFDYPEPGDCVPFGEGRVYDEKAEDLLIVTYGNGVPMSLRAARRLSADRGVRARILDLRWLNPMPAEWVGRHAAACGRVLLVDEGRRTGGMGEAMITAVVEHGPTGTPMRRVAGADSYIPLGPAAKFVLPSEDDLVREATALLDG